MDTKEGENHLYPLTRQKNQAGFAEGQGDNGCRWKGVGKQGECVEKVEGVF